MRLHVISSHEMARDLVLTPDRVLDCYGLLCPVPVRKTARAIEEMEAGQLLQVIATDEWFGPDLQAWLRHHPHELLAVSQKGEEVHAFLRKREVMIK